jgi:hypothetical protein
MPIKSLKNYIIGVLSLALIAPSHANEFNDLAPLRMRDNNVSSAAKAHSSQLNYE